MTAGPEFLAHARDLFADLGPIRTGRLFSGTALYVDDAMFAVVFGDTLYMKADKALANEYARAGSQPFQYATKTGTRIIPGLVSLPESALDDPAEAMGWAQKSMEPARRAAAKRARNKKGRK